MNDVKRGVKNILRTLALLVLVTLPLASGQAMPPSGDRYDWLSDNDSGYYYFDKLTFRLIKDPYFPEQKYLDVWIRLQFLPDGIDAEATLRHQNKVAADAYQSLSHRMCHYWFRQKERQYQLLEMVDFDDMGKELENKKFKYASERWVSIIPGTDYDVWQLKFAAYQQRLAEEKKKRQ